MNDILFTRLHQRSVIVDHNDEQIKYIFIILGTSDTINWANNTFSLFEKITNDDTLYNDLFQAKSKEDIIQCLSDMAVRIQLPVLTPLSFHAIEETKTKARKEETCLYGSKEGCENTLEVVRF